MKINEIWNRLAFWSRRARLDGELAAELEAHVDLLARDFEQEGMSPADARAAARRRLGNVSGIRECSRDLWGFPALEMVLQDIRYALRGLRRAPGFTATVILTLGLGIGANAAMFGVVDRLMFRPVAWMHDPGTVSRVYLRSIDRGRESTDWSMEYTRYLDLRKWTSCFAQYAAFAQRTMALGTGNDVTEVQVGTVSAGFFDFFDARPALGRWFVAAEDSTPRGADVAVLSYPFWQTQYGGSPDVIGKHIQVANMLVEIVGVAPKGFTGIQDNDPASIFIPITTFAGSRDNRNDATQYYTHYNWGWMEMMVRRKPSVSIPAASVDLSQAYLKSWSAEAQQERITPAELAKPRAFAAALRVGGGPDPSLETRTALWTIGVASIVLLIACANVANLFLARALRRRREIAMRIALGSSRARLAAQCFTESLVLAIAGGAVGVAVAQWGGAVLQSLFVRGNAPVSAFTDWRTLGFAFAAATALFAGLLTGIGTRPARRPRRLGGDAQGRRARRDVSSFASPDSASRGTGRALGDAARRRRSVCEEPPARADDPHWLRRGTRDARNRERARDAGQRHDGARARRADATRGGRDARRAADELGEQRAVCEHVVDQPVRRGDRLGAKAGELQVCHGHARLLQDDGHAHRARAGIRRERPQRRAAGRRREREHGKGAVAGTRCARPMHACRRRHHALHDDHRRRGECGRARVFRRSDAPVLHAG